MPSPISFRSHAIICGMPRLFSTGKIPSLPAFGSDFAPFFLFFLPFVHVFEQTRTVKVGNISDLASEREIKEFFSFSGDIDFVQIQRLYFLNFKVSIWFFFLEFFLSSWYGQPIFVKFSSGCVGVCVFFFFYFINFYFILYLRLCVIDLLRLFFMLWANGCHISQLSCFFCHCLSLCWLRICASSGVGDSRTAFVTFKDPKALEIALLLSVILIFLEPYSLAIFNVCIIAQLYIS